MGLNSESKFYNNIPQEKKAQMSSVSQFMYLYLPFFSSSCLVQISLLHKVKMATYLFLMFHIDRSRDPFEDMSCKSFLLLDTAN